MQVIVSLDSAHERHEHPSHSAQLLRPKLPRTQVYLDPISRPPGALGSRAFLGAQVLRDVGGAELQPTRRAARAHPPFGLDKVVEALGRCEAREHDRDASMDRVLGLGFGAVEGLQRGTAPQVSIERLKHRRARRRIGHFARGRVGRRDDRERRHERRRLSRCAQAAVAAVEPRVFLDHHALHVPVHANGLQQLAHVGRGAAGRQPSEPHARAVAGRSRSRSHLNARAMAGRERSHERLGLLRLLVLLLLLLRLERRIGLLRLERCRPWQQRRVRHRTCIHLQAHELEQLLTLLGWWREARPGEERDRWRQLTAQLVGVGLAAGPTTVSQHREQHHVGSGTGAPFRPNRLGICCSHDRAPRALRSGQHRGSDRRPNDLASGPIHLGAVPGVSDESNQHREPWLFGQLIGRHSERGDRGQARCLQMLEECVPALEFAAAHAACSGSSRRRSSPDRRQ